MPIYVYEVVKANGEGGERFEVMQSMKEGALTRHPASGEPVRRVLQAPHLTTRYGEGGMKGRLENANLEKAGFTKYERDKLTGRYHRVAGKEGPAEIKRPE